LLIDCSSGVGHCGCDWWLLGGWRQQQQQQQQQPSSTPDVIDPFYPTPLRPFSPSLRSDLVRVVVGADGRGRQKKSGEGDQQQQQRRRRHPIASDHRERADDVRRRSSERMSSDSRSGAIWTAIDGREE